MTIGWGATAKFCFLHSMTAHGLLVFCIFQVARREPLDKVGVLVLQACQNDRSWMNWDVPAELSWSELRRGGLFAKNVHLAAETVALSRNANLTWMSVVGAKTQMVASRIMLFGTENNIS